MASYYSKWVADDDWRLRLDVSTTTGSTGYTYSATLYLQNTYGSGASPFNWSITIDGSTKSGTFSSSISGGKTYKLGTYSKTVSRTHSAKTVKFSFTAKRPGSGVSDYRTGVTGTGSSSLPAKPSYKVTYSANGGSGAPGSQTKWYGETLKLSSTKPTRTGHTFKGWAKSSSGSVAYQPGASYTSNAALSLYAVWQANTWKITYNANGGSGAPAAQTKTYGKTLTLSSTRPTRTNYNFLGWSTSSSATTAQYQPGGSFTTNATTTLYAVWQLAYTAPRITSVTADRCGSSGALNEEGTYALVKFNWATDKTVSSVKIVCNGATTTVTASGTSGSVSRVVGAGALSTESEYRVSITVADSTGSSSYSTGIPPLDYIIDFSPQGGIGIGFPAPNSKELVVHTPMTVNDAVTFGGGGTALVENTTPNARTATSKKLFDALDNVAYVKAGKLTMTPQSGKVVSKRVDFDEPFPSQPCVFTNPMTSAPNKVSTAAAAIDEEGFTLYFYRDGTSATSVMWVAVLP